MPVTATPKRPRRQKLTWHEWGKRVGFLAVALGLQIPKAAAEIAYRRGEAPGDTCARAYRAAKRRKGGAR
jgi:hypothetical protein